MNQTGRAVSVADVTRQLAEAKPPGGGAREFAFTHDDFDRIARLIHQHAGISLSPIKFDMVYSRLARRLRATGDTSFADYIRRLERNDRAEWETFVNSLTTNLTSFFREAHHFDLLKQHLTRLGKPNARIWCSAASTGEEPYSIAITCCELYGSMSPPVEIIATDIDTSVLAHGQAGVYGEERIEKMAPELVRKYFVRDAAGRTGEVRVRPELQRLIRFSRVNLLEPNWPVRGPLEAIFCRNVMIYFDKPTQYGILKRFVPLLRPDGLMFAGHSESFSHAVDLFRNHGKTVYGRADATR
ncbi:MAG: chemotaxis protein CheR [Gammaproteobacteria bacterium]|nr:chemotaxis protein CheR [Gammaproteobacteria bacterium]MBU0770688.1 chemotaxis protein CheR [Gammaproteobacteria bacterium]MBU0857562.1 chemotaxis protein CheR [Gammaproteobacteria bacterium]MBU1848694.1 chemotaxis protein CheR [Gammaproteobacteria bacterium]